MKSIIFILATSLLFCGILFAQDGRNEYTGTEEKTVIVDSLFAVDRLSGSIYYKRNYITVDANWQEGETYIGDYFDMGWMYRFASIGYLSFELPEIPEGYELSSAHLIIFVFVTYGASIYGDYPSFLIGDANTFPDGILEHIDYGTVFNSNDVEPDSVYGTYTIFNQDSLIPHSTVSCDITECVATDIAAGRDLTQYRIYLQGFSDWDSWDDYVVIGSYSISNSLYSPKIMVTLTDGSSSNDLTIPQTTQFISVYPNPFREMSMLTVKTTEPGKMKLNVYNLKGQRVRSMESNSRDSGEFCFTWDGKDDAGKSLSTGVYLAEINTAKSVARTKMLYVK